MNDDSTLNRYRQGLLSLLRMRRDFVSARGDRLVDADGREVRDALAQYGTVVLGHNHRAVTAAATDFLAADGCCFVQPNVAAPTAALARRLVELGGEPRRRVCFSNSGAESVEAAIKLARLVTGRAKVVSLKNGFHGKTFAALSASGSDRYKAPGIVDVERFVSIAPGDTDALEAALEDGDVAAFLFEPVLGEGGMEAVDTAFLRAAIAACRRRGVVVVADEIQCGLYRCGPFSVALAEGLDVDVLLLGKGLSGGLVSIGAMLYPVLPGVVEFEKKHSSTFAGGGLACSVALAVLAELSAAAAVRHVAALSARIDDRAAALRTDVRSLSITGTGLLRGVAFADPHRHDNYFAVFCHNAGLLAYLVCSYLLERHAVLTMPLLSRPCAIRFEPPLTAPSESVDRFFDAVAEVGELLDAGRYDLLMAHLVGVDPETLEPPGRRIPVANGASPLAESLPCDADAPEPHDFAFLMHVTEREDVVRILPRAVREGYDRAAQLRLADLFLAAGELDPSPAACLSFRMPVSGRPVRGLLLLSPLRASRMLRLSRLARERLLDEYVALAAAHGVSRVGLGGYTSVISGAGTTLVDRYPGIGITTGNRLTAATIVDQFDLLYPRAGGADVCVVGARGSVGAAVALELARRVPRLVLVGRSGASVTAYRAFLVGLVDAILSGDEAGEPGSVARRLREFAASGVLADRLDRTGLVAALCSDELDSSAPIVVTPAIGRVLERTRHVVSCTSEGRSFIDAAALRDDAVVLDGARPFDVVPDAASTARVHAAGLVRLPRALAIGDCNLAIDEPGVALSCFAEALLLAAAGVPGHHGIGARPRPDELEAVRRLARDGGCTPCLLAPRSGAPGTRSPTPVRPRAPATRDDAEAPVR